MITDYQKFLKQKQIKFYSTGIDVNAALVHPMLFPFQRDITLWALHKGRSAVFADTGLGKTFIQVEWARLIARTALIIAPLNVSRQTIKEAQKIGVTVRYAKSQADVSGPGIWITNYERIDGFAPSLFDAVVLDESSILKALDGKTRKRLTEMFSATPYRLCCTATPAPNDQSEIGNHAEFLGVATMQEMLSMFFIHANKVNEIRLGDGRVLRKKLGNDKGQEWRLKYNAREAFFQWLSSWGMFVRKPSNLGYDDNGFALPKLTIKPVFVASDYVPDDKLFFTGLSGIQDRNRIRKSTALERATICAELVNASTEQWIVWCGLNTESATLAKLINDSVEVVGSDSAEDKAEAIEQFKSGDTKVLITKAKIAGYGMNFQNAHNMIFFGLSDSWETYYQAIRREWRFGQPQPVSVYIIISELERDILENVKRKERVADEMASELISRIRDYEQKELHMQDGQVSVDYSERTATGNGWTAMMGDSCRRMAELADNSIDLSVYSPPFADLYTYTNLENDLGNSKNWTEFFEHYAYIIKELLRVTKPGRLTCVHTADIPAMEGKDGYIGVKDFPGEVIKAYTQAGWVFHGRISIDKNPQAQALRTKSKGLLFAQMEKDSTESRPGIADYILLFKKPGDNAVPVQPVKNGELTRMDWILWARPVWYAADYEPGSFDAEKANQTEKSGVPSEDGIRETDTLQYSTARAADDEKHICPLQLGTIERCIKLYSNPGETVLTPFMGIGSEAYQAIRFHRKAVGIELKESYFEIAVKNLHKAEQLANAPTLFNYADK